MTDRKFERRGLGRGLSALMADISLDEPGGSSPPQSDQMVAVEKIAPNPDQPRRTFHPEALKDLADSIRQRGVIQPLIVRAIPDSDRYEIVAGERRWRAAQIAQLHEVPVLVRVFTDSEVLEVAIIENIQRAELNAVEEALAYRQLMERFGHTQEMIATALSRSRSHIANLLRLLSLPEPVQQMISSGTLSAGHARALITTADPLALAAVVVGKGLSVRETEALVRKKASVGAGRTKKPSEKDADTRAIESDLSANLKMGVRIDHDKGGEGGRLSISYSSLAQLDRLCQILSLIPRDADGF